MTTHDEGSQDAVRSARLSLSLLSLSAVLATRSLPAQSEVPAWSDPFYWYEDSPGYQRAGYEIAHAGLIGKPGPHQGKVLLWRTGPPFTNPNLWDPAAPYSLADAHPQESWLDNLFCAGHSFDGDGDLIIAGGHRNWQCDTTEPNWSYVLRPDVLSWGYAGNLVDEVVPFRAAYGHYYPGTVALHNGQVASVGGGTAPWNASCPGTAPVPVRQNEWQVFDKPTWSWLGVGGAALPGLPTGWRFDYYPLLSVLSSGHLFASVIWNGQTSPSQKSPSAFIDVNGSFPPTGSWTMKASSTWLQVLYGTQVRNPNLLYPTGFLWPWTVGQTVGSDRMVIIGGWDTNRMYSTSPPTGSPAEQRVWQIQSPVTVPTSSWGNPSGWGALNIPRIYANSVILPNLTVLVVGGSRNEFKPYQTLANGEVNAQPVYEPELLDLLNPAAGWQLITAGPHVSPRLYHSVAVLLKDGRVIVMGGYRSNLASPTQSGWSHSDAEIFNPPYIGEARPSIDVAPATLTYGGGQFDVQVSSVPAVDIDFATLIRCSSVTHHFDWDQRCVRLNVVQASANQVTLTGLPSTAQNGHFIAPPGYYMLHVVTKPTAQNVRVPSVGWFVKIG